MGGSIGKQNEVRRNEVRRRNEKKRVLVVTLDKNGKSSTLYKDQRFVLKKILQERIASDSSEPLTPISEISSLSLDYGGRMGGRRTVVLHAETITDMNAMQTTSGVVFVFDSNDVDIMEEIRDEIVQLMGQKRFRSTPLLLIARMSDDAKCLTLEQLKQRLQLSSLPKYSKWLLQSSRTNDTIKSGIRAGMTWLGCTWNQESLWSKNTSHPSISSEDDREPSPEKWSLLPQSTTFATTA